MSSTNGPMACPMDGATLVMSERSGIEIDYCPTCRGVWLDRGELDKIIERSAEAAPSPSPSRAAPLPEPRGHHRDFGHGHDQAYGQEGYPRRKRKKSFLEDLFD